MAGVRLMDFNTEPGFRPVAVQSVIFTGLFLDDKAKHIQMLQVAESRKVEILPNATLDDDVREFQRPAPGQNRRTIDRK